MRTTKKERRRVWYEAGPKLIQSIKNLAKSYLEKMDSTKIFMCLVCTRHYKGCGWMGRWMDGWVDGE